MYVLEPCGFQFHYSRNSSALYLVMLGFLSIGDVHHYATDETDNSAFNTVMNVKPSHVYLCYLPTI